MISDDTFTCLAEPLEKSQSLLDYDGVGVGGGHVGCSHEQFAERGF